MTQPSTSTGSPDTARMSSSRTLRTGRPGLRRDPRRPALGGTSPRPDTASVRAATSTISSSRPRTDTPGPRDDATFRTGPARSRRGRVAAARSSTRSRSGARLSTCTAPRKATCRPGTAFFGGTGAGGDAAASRPAFSTVGPRLENAHRCCGPIDAATGAVRIETRGSLTHRDNNPAGGRVGAPGHRRSAGRRALRNGRRQATPEVIASSIQLVAAQPQKVRVQADPSEAALIPLRPNDDSRTISLSDGVQQLVLNVGIRSRPRGDRSDQQRLVAQEARTGARFRPLPLPDVRVCSAESGRGEIA